MKNNGLAPCSWIKFSWHEIDGKDYLIAYDLENYELIKPLIDYALHLSDKQMLDPKTVRNEMVFLKAFFKFLGPNGVLVNVTDSTLIAFRDDELAKIVCSCNSRGDDFISKRTVNLKLRRVYYFLSWCQESKKIPPGSIGQSGCKVTANFQCLSPYAPFSVSRLRLKKVHFPVLFRKAGGASTNRPRHFATEDEKIKLHEYFRMNGTEFTFMRNVLLMEIADRAGLRRGSINALTCRQFDPDYSTITSTETLEICPSQQKFGSRNIYRVEFDLRLRVNAFIKSFRAQFLRDMGWNEDRTGDCIFISARDGRPLTVQAISAIFGKAFKAIGAPHGAGIHSFRRKYADGKVEKEIRARIRLGLDTSVASVAASVAIEMGHSNPDSITSYVNRAQSRMLVEK
ncbi:site-specific integrase [Glaciimonas soli]|uniref:Tyr recombinase domain-containing protein n=1 Tax=Glaciimonas soli TaxID=2590999 RepID=A0A843YT01_9BURK|nr:site-specific integrase [Glaciimonas soli]MQR01117.1 hypothetical protein [Glaciimonas soli]